MKLTLYKSLFHVFSFLSDKTNGVSFFVKYKLLLGTLIIGLSGTSAKAQKKEFLSDTVLFRKPLYSEMASCYKVYIYSTKAPQTSDTLNIKEVVVIGCRSIVKDRSSIACYAVQVIEEPTIKVKAPINIDSITNKPLNINIANEIIGIMCYGITVNPYNNDDIYAHKPREREFYYHQVTTKPISPVGNLEDFEKWVQSYIRYTEQIRKDKIEGEVKLSFVIDKKGKLINKKIVKGLSKEVDKEVLNAVSKSKKWKPGQLYGDPVKTEVTITVKLSSNIE
ncbi:energy transducer TonB [Dysgonomonas sp. Marseille-P4677]|uniref:energy transducer TonB n=1 Tax=Dysgonomonas sp. Marseille-P4677 TaxID=2364790 RepID=UPI0019139838|nr:energy transducer TonB [Dysgonomonas sp. Marseille-P4677]MBK5721434.1 energy transducer TonB [Dysgonomonas sp. Marseille-P4677]